MNRRHFLHTSAWAAPTLLCRAKTTVPTQILGQGDFRYRQIPGWGVLDKQTPVKNCHGLVEDSEGHIILLTDEVQNNVIVYSPDGKLVSKWGHHFPGAHGLTLVQEDGREVLYLTDTVRHRVFKTTLDGEILQEWGPPTGPPAIKEEDYKPSWTLHDPASGDFYVLDGYGTDHIIHYDSAGKEKKVFGGQAGGITHWGPHGGIFNDQKLLIAMSDQQHLLEVSTDGTLGKKVPLPGGNPRQIFRKKNHYFVGHLADNWPADRNSRGFISVLDADFRVVSNIGGTAPKYDNRGTLQKMSQQGEAFQHPHDLIVGQDDSLYVAQYASGNTYPLKFERV
ncbi:hypothetical protein AAFN60_21085 [Roseibacillus persicicus]|uniref:6-bladed beta-propeller n=1 Tax=Roseibacillus persicicus TaxID=454148 RepID=UPI00398A61A7